MCGDLQVSSKSNLCQEAERKQKEKQESLVKGLDEAVKEREVQGRRDYAAQQEAAVQVRREEIRFFDPCLCLFDASVHWFYSHISRQENLLAKRLAGWGIGEEANPAVIKILYISLMLRQSIVD